jgi:hypothetical protein
VLLDHSVRSYGCSEQLLYTCFVSFASLLFLISVLLAHPCIYHYEEFAGNIYDGYLCCNHYVCILHLGVLLLVFLYQHYPLYM